MLTVGGSRDSSEAGFSTWIAGLCRRFSEATGWTVRFVSDVIAGEVTDVKIDRFSHLDQIDNFLSSFRSFRDPQRTRLNIDFDLRLILKFPDNFNTIHQHPRRKRC